MSSPAPSSATLLARRVRHGEVTALEAVEGALRRIAAEDAAIGAFVAVDSDGARERARALDRRLVAGEDPGPLTGVPVAIKDNLSRVGWPLSCASRILDGYRAPFTATAVARLEDAGAVLVGRTNLDEFAMGSSGERSSAGAPVNPWDHQRVAGGSSAGSAAAVAAGLVPLALGSDTGGSVRQPAAFCGAVGLRPTWGRVSRWGLVAFASSLDQVGPLVSRVEDAALVLELMGGPDGRDATCAAAPKYRAQSGPWGEVTLGGEVGKESLAGVRCGVVRQLAEEPLEAGAEEDFQRALTRLRALGATVEEVSVPTVQRTLEIYQVISCCEASANLARFDGVCYGRRRGWGEEPPRDLEELYRASRGRGFGSEVQRRVLMGAFGLAEGYRRAFYQRAVALREDLRHSLTAILGAPGGDGGVDVLVSPTTPGGAFRHGERLEDPVAMARSDMFTLPAALAGLPAVSVPSGLDPDGLPLGLQITGRAFDEATVLGVAAAFEAVTDFPGCGVQGERND